MKRAIVVLLVLLAAVVALAAPLYQVTDTASVPSTLTTIFISPNILANPNWCVTVKNTGSVALVDLAVDEGSTATGPWSSLVWTACDGLTAGNVCNYCTAGSAYRYMRVQARTSTGTTSTSVAFTAN